MFNLIEKTKLAEKVLNDSIKADFADDRVLGKPDEVGSDFFELHIIKKEHTPRGFVDLNKVVGSEHSSYVGLTWLEMLNNLVRRENYLYSLSEEMLKFYTEPSLFNKEGVADANITFYNGQGYIGDGNHRICIAKFLYVSGLIPKNSLGPLWITNIRYNKFDLLRFLKVRDDFIKSVSSSTQIYNIGARKGNIDGRPIYLLLCKTRSGKEFTVECADINALEKSYVEYLYHPKGLMSRFIQSIFHTIGFKKSA
jgi:hypothetical protein